MTTKLIARCGIYEKRPKLCRDYPTVEHWTPPECGFTFDGVERGGQCDCDVGACCNVPREGGEPGGAPMPEISGGEPCKHLEWKEEPMEKTAELVFPPKPRRECELLKAVAGE